MIVSRIGISERKQEREKEREGERVTGDREKEGRAEATVFN